MSRMIVEMMEINVPFNGAVARRGNLSALLSVGNVENGKVSEQKMLETPDNEAAINRKLFYHVYGNDNFQCM